MAEQGDELKGVESLLVIPSFHYDVAYLKPYAEYLPDCFRILDEALRILERETDWRFLVEQVILLDEYVRRFPDRLGRLRQLCAAGRLSVAPGMWVMPDMNHPDGESMFRQIELGRRWLAEKLEFRPTVCWIADCWGHHAQLPAILKACGYERYVFWRCMRRDVMRQDFVWRGLDGSEIQTHWIARGYGNIVFPSTADVVNALEMDNTSCSPAAVRTFGASLLKFGHASALIVCNGGDMAYPQASGPEVVRRLNASGKLPPMTFATPAEALARIEPRGLPVVEGEFNSALQGTFTSNVWIKQCNRTLTQRLQAVEAMAAVAGRDIDTDAAWKLLLKQQFHDIICGTITDAALEDCRREFAEAEGLIEAVRRSLEHKSGTERVFNSLDFERTETIGSHGRRVRVTVPAMGFAVVDAGVTAPGCDVELPRDFENAWYRARVGADGHISELVEASTDAMVAAGTPCPFGALALQMDYGDLWLNFSGPLSGGSAESALVQNDPDPLERCAPGAITMGTVLATVRSASAHETADEMIIEQRGVISYWRIQLPFETRMTLCKHSRQIEYATRLVVAGRHFRVRATFPTGIADGERIDDIPYGLQTGRTGEHVVQHFVAWRGRAAGVALLNRGMPAANVSDGILMATLLRSAAMEYKTPSTQSYLEGQTLELAYAVVPFAREDVAAVVREGRAFNAPLVSCTGDAIDAWGAIAEGATVTGVRRVAGGVQLRIEEKLGRGANVRLRLPAGVRSAWRTDGVGERIEPLGTEFTLRPFEVVSALLETS